MTFSTFNAGGPLGPLITPNGARDGIDAAAGPLASPATPPPTLALAAAAPKARRIDEFFHSESHAPPSDAEVQLLALVLASTRDRRELQG